MKATALTAIFLISISFSYSQSKDSLVASKPPAKDSVIASKPPSKDSLIAPWWVEKFKLTAGLFVPINNTKVQVEASGTSNGTEIDFNKDLGFDAAQLTFLANFEWRISRRSRINLAYYNMNRTATHTLQRDITFNDQTYHINSSVSTYFNTAIYQFSYGYAFIEKPTYEVGVLIGAHTVGTKAGISLDGTGAGVSTDNNFGFTAPLPDLGIWGGYAFSDRFAANLDFDYLALTINNINGRIIAYNLILQYKLMRQLSLSLAYTGLNFNVKTTKKNVAGDFRWGYNGPAIGVTLSFGERSWKH